MNKNYNYRFFRGHCPGIIFYQFEKQGELLSTTLPVHLHERGEISQNRYAVPELMPALFPFRSKKENEENQLPIILANRRA